MSGTTTGWKWDETLYAGSGRYYAAGRMPYPAAFAKALRAELDLDGTGRLLDVGCGPGQLTLLLAPLFGSAIGIDGSSGMIAAARTRAARAGIRNVRWQVLRAEDISPGLGRFRAVTFAQSFHWLDRPRVAQLVRDVLEPGGACVIVYATTHAGVPGDDPLPMPRPPRAEIERLIGSYLGSNRRAGRGTRPQRERPGDDTMLADDAVLARAGFSGPVRVPIEPGPVTERDEEEIVASVFSLSYAAPSLFGARKRQFEQDLRALLRRASPGGRFCEQPSGSIIDIWRPAP
jgi:SAM-dependent methyltransferase